jgi:hypothetical protein
VTSVSLERLHQNIGWTPEFTRVELPRFAPDRATWSSDTFTFAGHVLLLALIPASVSNRSRERARFCPRATATGNLPPQAAEVERWSRGGFLSFAERKLGHLASVG